MTYDELAAKLHLLSVKGEFRKLILAADADLCGFIPETGKCHDNADRWVVDHPQHRVVRGYIIFNDCFFGKHSVVEIGHCLLDITPRPPNESRTVLSFIVFEGISRARFDAWPNQVSYLG